MTPPPFRIPTERWTQSCYMSSNCCAFRRASPKTVSRLSTFHPALIFFLLVFPGFLQALDMVVQRHSSGGAFSTYSARRPVESLTVAVTHCRRKPLRPQWTAAALADKRKYDHSEGSLTGTPRPLSRTTAVAVH